MSWLFLVGTTLLSMLPTVPAPACANSNCLPAGIESNEVVSAQVARPGKGGGVVTVTVAQKLRELKAHCRKGKLVDSKGKEIRFYRLIGCWGNPPEDYQGQLDRQAKELATLRKRYRVIEMTCNPSGQMISQLHYQPPKDRQ
jgi:hypothetical protein